MVTCINPNDKCKADRFLLKEFHQVFPSLNMRGYFMTEKLKEVLDLNISSG